MGRQVVELLQASSVPDLAKWPPLLAAVAIYTFDLSLLSPAAPPEDNFDWRLNERLRQRDPRALHECQASLHYLMAALQALPSYGAAAGAAGVVVWRGVPREARGALADNYRLGRRVHWSGFSSASAVRGVAERFAGEGGALVRVRLVGARSLGRDLRLVSALPSEAEVLVLPNFAGRVTEELRPLDGVDTVDLLEEADAATLVF